MEVWGANGSGKTTLLRCIAGLSSFDQGEIDVGDVGTGNGEELLYLGHKSGLNPLLTPFENMRWYADISDVSVDDASTRRALEHMGLDGAMHRPCHTLSAGQQRRAALARLGLSEAKLWLLDEPFAALDEQGADLVRSAVVGCRQNGGAVLCATHQRLGIADARVLELGDL